VLVGVERVAARSGAACRARPAQGLVVAPGGRAGVNGRVRVRRFATVTTTAVGGPSGPAVLAFPRDASPRPWRIFGRVCTSLP